MTDIAQVNKSVSMSLVRLDRERREIDIEASRVLCLGKGLCFDTLKLARREFKSTTGQGMITSGQLGKESAGTSLVFRSPTKVLHNCATNE